MHIVQNMVRPALFGLLASIFILLAAPERAIAGDADQMVRSTNSPP